MVYKIFREVFFSAAHSLRNYHGKCEKTHGHNWKVRVTVESDRVSDIGIVVDFEDLKKALKEVTNRFDHQNINEVPPFERINPSSENLAKFIFEKVSPKINKKLVRVSEVKVWEVANSCASYSED